jgi:hypothetical protein
MNEPRPERPGLREQLRRTRAAATALAAAHLDLLKAELGAISGEIKSIGAMVGAIVAVAVFAGSLLAIGGALFLGEWLFGSIGWGVLHGLLLSIGLITAFGLRIVDVPGRILVRGLASAIVIGLVVGLALGLNLARGAAQWGADWAIANLVPSLDPGWAPVVVAAAFAAALLGVAGLFGGARAGGGSGAIGGLVAGALGGALVGAFLGGMTYDGRGGAALGVAVGLVAWPALMGLGAARTGIDAKARFGRLWPRRTYETALATKTWLEQEWTRRRQRLSSR